MPFDGNGVFNRLFVWTQDAASAIKIKSDRHDQNDDDLAAGLTNCLTKDGQTQPSGNLPMNGKKLVNLGTPTNDTDASTKAYVDAIKSFKTGLEIAGADSPNGQLKFTSATGANGLAFVGADLSWIAKLATAAGPGTPPVPPATLNRLVLNTKPDGTGTDVVTVNDDGTIVAASTITATSQLISKATTGNVHVWLKGPADEDRAVIYTDSASMGHAHLRVNGTQDFQFQNTGHFLLPGNLYTGNGATVLQTDGNISGGAFGGYLTTYINNTANNAALAYANDRVANLQYRRTNQQYSGNVQGVWTCPAGSVISGYSRENGTSGQVYGLYYIYLQVYDPVRGWVGFSG